VNPVAIAIVGNALIKGVPTASAVAVNPPPVGFTPVTKITPGTVIASTSGGATIGANKPFRCTTTTANRQLRK
jgi:hypothetical protein